MWNGLFRHTIEIQVRCFQNSNRFNNFHQCIYMQRQEGTTIKLKVSQTTLVSFTTQRKEAPEYCYLTQLINASLLTTFQQVLCRHEKWPLSICDVLSRPLVLSFPETFRLFSFPFFPYECTEWRLFQKRVNGITIHSP